MANSGRYQERQIINLTGTARDWFMDMVLDGYKSGTIMKRFGIQNHKEYIRTVKQAFYDRSYKPTRPRRWRGGKRKSNMDRRLIKRYREKKYPPLVAVNLLARPPKEIFPEREELIRENPLREVAVQTDILLAHHYLIHCHRESIISDRTFRDCVAEEIEFGAGAGILKQIEATGNKAENYPAHIRSLARYMLYKHHERKKEWRTVK